MTTIITEPAITMKATAAIIPGIVAVALPEPAAAVLSVDVDVPLDVDAMDEGLDGIGESGEGLDGIGESGEGLDGIGESGEGLDGVGETNEEETKSVVKATTELELIDKLGVMDEAKDEDEETKSKSKEDEETKGITEVDIIGGDDDKSRDDERSDGEDDASTFRGVLLEENAMDKELEGVAEINEEEETESEGEATSELVKMRGVYKVENSGAEIAVEPRMEDFIVSGTND